MQIEIQFFGPLREKAPDGRLSLTVPDDCRVRDVRTALAAHVTPLWPESFIGLLTVSAFADEHAILRDDESITDGARLAVLPPVNGG